MPLSRPFRLLAHLRPWAAAAVLTTLATGQSPTGSFDVDLGRLELQPGKGNWERSGSGEAPEWRQLDAAAYDLCCWAPRTLSGRYSLRVTIRHVSGQGAGLVFHSEKPEGPRHAEMLRFETPGTMLQGYFLRGEFVCRKVLKLPRAIQPDSWNELRLEIDGEARRCAVYVNDELVAKELVLQYSCGHAGLQASESVARFRDFRAKGEHAAAPGLAWPRSAVVQEGELRVHSPALQRTWRLRSPDGTPELLPGHDSAPAGAAPAGYGIESGIVRFGEESFAAEEIAPFDPVSLVRWRDRIWAIDLAGARLVEVPTGGSEPVRVLFPGPGLARVEIGAAGEPRFERELEGLAPGSRHVVEAPQHYRCIPQQTWTRRVAFTTPPGPGLTRARRIRVLAVVCGNVFDNVIERDADWPADEYERVRAELEVARRWFWIQSGFRLLLDIDYLREERCLDVAGLTAEGRPYGRPRTDLVHGWAKEAGHEIGRYQSVLVIQAYRRKSPNASKWRYVGTGGGLTLGAHGRGYGISWWFVPEQRGYNAWLLCHEFHHQLDALFELSGHPEYWYNHFSPTIGTAANFGEHWDGNAHILREWPDWQWDALRYGDAVLLTDRDGDGFPDDAPATPMDEKRFGSSPEKADSDGDGLDDVAEIRLRRTVDDSGFEVLAAGHAQPDPMRRDSDRDGLGDAEDPLPLLPFDPGLEAGEWRSLRRITSPHLERPVELAIRAVQGKGGCTLEIAVLGLARRDRAELRFLLDLGANGWFVGRDNVEIQYRPFVRGARPRVQFQDAAEPGQWPHSAPELAKDFPLEVEGGEEKLLLRIPPSVKHGYAGRPGARVQLVAGLRSVRSRRAGLPWISFFEPHVLVPLSLPGP